MKALLLYPRFPQSFWSYNRTIEMVGLKALQPVKGSRGTIAALSKPTSEGGWIDQ